MTYTIRVQSVKRYSGTGYWQVSAGSFVLIGRPCRDITRAKARAKHYVDSGRAAKRYSQLMNRGEQ